MNEDDGYFGATVAATYDAASADMFEAGVVDPAVDVLAELAGDGRALEFGIGTGRIALPLAQRGIEVHGIDLSLATVDRLRAKPGGSDVGVTIGDFADTRVAGEFSLTYLVFNTICNLTTQEAQVACFVNAADICGLAGTSSSRLVFQLCVCCRPANEPSLSRSATATGLMTCMTAPLRQ
ncbi:MAG: hypothetical protein V7643_4656 [Mycobacterium sp.]